MLAPRIVYFFFFAALANLMPYLALYYQSLGLTGSQIGLLTGIPPIIGLLAAPIWGAIADATRQHRRILLVTIIGTVLAVLVFSLANGFAPLVLAVAVYSFFLAPIIPLVDNSVIEQLGPRREEYGKQRVWGSVGWGLAGLISGWLVQKYGLQIMFYTCAGLLSCSLPAAGRFPVSRAPLGIKLDRSAIKLFLTRRWLLFLGVFWSIGAGMFMVGNYFFIYLKDLGAPEPLMGISLTIAMVSEIPMLFYSNRLIRRFGLLGLLLIGAGVFGLRALVFSVAVAPWQALALQLLHGLTYALVLVAGVEYASQIAPPGLGATAQGIFGGVFTGLAAATGSLVGGLLLDSIGIRAMYQVAAIGVFLAAGGFFFASRKWKGSSLMEAS
jgi:MFS transporter, PPP family, 3-phenylpropionic acid transporter